LTAAQVPVGLLILFYPKQDVICGILGSGMRFRRTWRFSSLLLGSNELESELATNPQIVA
jgi:hypothetical protein